VAALPTVVALIRLCARLNRSLFKETIGDSMKHSEVLPLECPGKLNQKRWILGLAISWF
jgi:hypothetical protein